MVGGLSAIGAALMRIGIPKNSVPQYETAIKADGFLVMANGSASDMIRAQTILATVKPAALQLHTAAPAIAAAYVPIHAGA